MPIAASSRSKSTSGPSIHFGAPLRAPVDRHHLLRRDQLHCGGGRARIGVPLTQRRTPAPDGDERYVDLAEVAHLVEQVGVAGEVDRGRT